MIIDVVWLLGFVQLCVAQSVVVTTSGSVEGVDSKTAISQRDFVWFKGIPYAEPPIGDLRFEPPVEVTPWTETLKATDSRSFCIETSRDGKDTTLNDEDCLYLDIATPGASPTGVPVVVYIFGEGFTAGQSITENTEPDLFIEQDIVYVTLRYRLGIFGFISTGDDAAPGNNGLRDQIMALTWIKNNIASFGGNPTKVTLAGIGGGAICVHWLSQSKLAEGLFTQTILESGTALSLWALSNEAKKATENVAKELKIKTTTNSYDLIDLLKGIDADELQKVAHKQWLKLYNENPLQSRIFGPVIESANDPISVITQSAYQALLRKKVRPVPTIIGFNSDEGNNEALSGYFMKQCATYDLFSDQLIPNNMNVEGYFNKLSVGNKIKQSYFGIFSPCLQHDNKAKFFGDDIFIRPIIETVRLQAALGTTYFYKFSHSGTWTIKNTDGKEDEIKGVGHYEEIPYLFHSDKFSLRDRNEVKIRTKLVALWSNFIKEGNPTPATDPITDNVVWTAATKTKQYYLDISESLQVKVKPNDETVKFWNELYANFGAGVRHTY